MSNLSPTKVEFFEELFGMETVYILENEKQNFKIMVYEVCLFR